MESYSQQQFVATGNTGNSHVSIDWALGGALQYFRMVNTSAMLLVIKKLRAGSVHMTATERSPERTARFFVTASCKSWYRSYHLSSK